MLDSTPTNQGYYLSCSGCSKRLNRSKNSLAPGSVTCRACRKARRVRPCNHCGATYDPQQGGGAQYCSRGCTTEAFRLMRAERPPRKPRKRPNKPNRDHRLGGRPRTRINAQVRARTGEPVCPLCGYIIDRSLPRVGSRHPLCSVIDEWLPRSKGGTVDLDNCVEVHDRCNNIKSDHWPVTPEMQLRCEAAVRSELLGMVRS